MTETEVFTIETPCAARSKTGGPLAGTASYPDAVSLSRQLTSDQWEQQYRFTTICGIEAGEQKFLLVKRPEHDGDVRADVMLFSLDKRPDGFATPDFFQLERVYPKEAVLMLDMTQLILKQFQSWGYPPNLTWAVLNESIYDSGLNQRLPQSLMKTHIKITARSAECLKRAGEISPEEQTRIQRPLQRELNRAVAYYLKRQADLGEVDSSRPLLVRLNNSEEMIALFDDVYVFLNTINNLVFLEFIQQRYEVKTGQVDWLKSLGSIQDETSGRISAGVVLGNIRRWIEYFDRQEQLYPDHNLGLASITRGYLEEMGRNIRMMVTAQPGFSPVVGPSFSLLIRPNFVAEFVPAEIVGKGADATTGVIVKEVQRPLTNEEVTGLVDSNQKLTAAMTAFGRKHNLEVKPGNFDIDRYRAIFGQP